MTPVNAACVTHRVTPATKCLSEPAIHLNGLRPGEQLLVEGDELVSANVARAAGWRFLPIRALSEVRSRSGICVFGRCQTLDPLEVGCDLRFERLGVVVRDH